MKKNSIYAALFALLALWPALSTAQERTALTLDECIDLALDNNILVRTAQLAEQQAIEKKREVFTTFFPTIAASGGLMDINRDLLDISLMGMPIQYVKSGNFALASAVQPVFAGGQIINGNKKARLGVDVSKLQHEQSKDEVRLTTERYYWNVVMLENKLVTIDALDSMLSRLLTDVTLAVKVGVKMQNDLLQVQLKQNEVAADRLKAENMLATSRALLAQYIGADSVDVAPDVDFDRLPPFPVEIKRDHESVLQGTKEYRLLEKNVEAKRLDKRIETGKHMPTLAVAAGLMSHNLIDGRQNLAAIYATLTVPLSDWWGGAHAIKRLKYEQDIAQEQLDDNAQLLLISMQNQWNAVEEAYKELALAQKSVGQSKENLRLNNDYYRAGTTPLSDLLQAQTLFQQSADGYIEAVAGYRLAVAQYRAATSTAE
ncbi:MAG: TolC family protein [Prevotella sp.]|nr:TolC family protein [Prevotella sp.]